jgi:hypothetical protein
LRIIYGKMLDHKARGAPVFSGDLGENIYENSARMLELFRNLPAAPGNPNSKGYSGAQKDNVPSTAFEIDEYFKLEAGDSTDSALGRQSNLSKEQRSYYEIMCQMYRANKDMQSELHQQRLVARGPLNFKHIFATQTNTGMLAAGSQGKYVPPGAL